jgi:hypothetical protein
VPLLAQSASNDTLTALLTEVRLLRQALERSAAAPQIQLLGTRLAVQNERLQAATRDYEATRAALQEVQTNLSDVNTRLQATMEVADRTTNNPQLQRELEEHQSALKYEIGKMTTREAQLRARESELGTSVASEQNEWLLLNRRLDEFERALGK